jgi:hypothetical protein
MADVEPDPPSSHLDDPLRPRQFRFRAPEQADFDFRHLPFQILTIHATRRPIAAPPFHIAGGDWTFLECVAVGDVRFLVGLKRETTSNGQPSWSGIANLMVSDIAAGKQFVEAFAKAFGGLLRPPSGSPAPRLYHRVATDYLAENCQQDEKGIFTKGGGDWTVLILKFDFPSTNTGVFLTLNLVERVGEFNERYRQDADRLTAELASSLRDGPRPLRTPASDPNLAAVAPRLGLPRQLLNRSTYQLEFSPDSRHAIYEEAGDIKAISIVDVDATPIVLAHFEHYIWMIHVLNADLDLLVSEEAPRRPGDSAADIRKRIWLVSRRSTTKQLIIDPEEGYASTIESPPADRRFLVFPREIPREDRQGTRRVADVWDLERNSRATIGVDGTCLKFVHWRQTPAGLRAAGVSNPFGVDEGIPSEYLLFDPVTGERDNDAQTGPVEPYGLLSPDGRHFVRLSEHEITIVNRVTGGEQPFVFHPEDQRYTPEFCLWWVSPDYLEFSGDCLSLIDVRTRKMTIPLKADDGQPVQQSSKFSPDMRWLLYHDQTIDGDGLFLASVHWPTD